MTKKKNSDTEAEKIEHALTTSFDLPELLEFAYQEGGFSVVPTQAGTVRGHALTATKGQTQIQLDMLLEQMRLLAQQAQTIKKRVDTSKKIYRATMNFEPDIGSCYHLYLKSNLECVLSLISPTEWGQEDRYGRWLAEVQLAADHTWKVIESSELFEEWKK